MCSAAGGLLGSPDVSWSPRGLLVVLVVHPKLHESQLLLSFAALVDLAPLLRNPAAVLAESRQHYCVAMPEETLRNYVLDWCHFSYDLFLLVLLHAPIRLVHSIDMSDRPLDRLFDSS